MAILVVGGFIVDLVATCPRHPNDGETVLSDSFNAYLGGSGAAGAVVASKMGAKVTMIGKLGTDYYGSLFLETLKNEKVDTSHIKVINDFKTGVSLITIDKNGQNRITTTLGANLSYSKDDLPELEDLVKKNDFILTQHELNEEINKYLCIFATKYHKKLVLDPTPERPISDELLKSLFIFAPNETELANLVNKKLVTLDDYKNAAYEVLKKGTKNVIVTLGSKGSLLVNKDETYFVPSFNVTAVDTVGAGDAYLGTLVAMLDQGYSLKDAMQVGTAAAALAVTKKGTVASMPDKKDVFSFLENHGFHYEI